MPELKVLKGLGALLLFVILAFLHWRLAIPAIRALSPTYDEPIHLTAGYVYLKTKDYRVNGFNHTPLGEMWAALPLLSLNPIIPKQHPAWVRHAWTPTDQYQFADAFLFRNRVDADRMMSAGRMMQVFLSIFLGGIVMLVAGHLGGLPAAFFSAMAWTFSPSILANATVVSTDLAFTFFFFCFFASFLFPHPKWKAILAGISLGGSLGSKYFTIAVGPILIAVFAWEWCFGREKVLRWIKANVNATTTLLFLFSFLFMLGTVYQFTGFDVFIEGFRQFMGRTSAGRSSFFWGRHSTQGWFFYFPFTILVKTPLPLLVALLVAVILSFRHKLKIPSVLWISPLIFLLITAVAKVQIGHRYILSVYPFLFVICGLALSSAMPLKWFGCILMAFYAIGAWHIRPHYLAYFNELIGGPANGYKYLTDSNIDWGQALKMLPQELEKDDLKNGIYLSYFGVVDPHVYKIPYKNIGSDTITAHQDDSGNPNLRPTKFVVSVTNLQSTYYRDKTVFDWLNAYSPWKKIGYSLFVYDFKNHPEAIERLERLR